MDYRTQALDRKRRFALISLDLGDPFEEDQSSNARDLQSMDSLERVLLCCLCLLGCFVALERAGSKLPS